MPRYLAGRRVDVVLPKRNLAHPKSSGIVLGLGGGLLGSTVMCKGQNARRLGLLKAMEMTGSRRLLVEAEPRRGGPAPAAASGGRTQAAARLGREGEGAGARWVMEESISHAGKEVEAGALERKQEQRGGGA